MNIRRTIRIWITKRRVRKIMKALNHGLKTRAHLNSIITVLRKSLKEKDHEFASQLQGNARHLTDAINTLMLDLAEELQRLDHLGVEVGRLVELTGYTRSQLSHVMGKELHE